jgi:hypothetical protein
MLSNFDPSEVDFVCFTNSYRIVPFHWEVRHAPLMEDLGGRLTARYYKIMGHKLLPSYEYTLWMDPTHALLEQPLAILERAIASATALSSAPGHSPVIWSHKHNDRTCAYSEANTCIVNKKGNSTAILLQLRRYYKEGFPEHWEGGLADTAVLLRHSSSPVLQQLCDAWWDEMGTLGSTVSGVYYTRTHTHTNI